MSVYKSLKRTRISYNYDTERNKSFEEKVFFIRQDSYRFFMNIDLLFRGSDELFGLISFQFDHMRYLDLIHLSQDLRPSHARAHARARILSTFFPRAIGRRGLRRSPLVAENFIRDDEDDDRVIGQRSARRERHALTELDAFAMAKPKADWSQFRSGGEAYPLQRSRGDGDDDAEAAVVAMARSRSGY